MSVALSLSSPESLQGEQAAAQPSPVAARPLLTAGDPRGSLCCLLPRATEKPEQSRKQPLPDVGQEGRKVEARAPVTFGWVPSRQTV